MTEVNPASPASSESVPVEAPKAIGGIALLVYNTLHRNWLSNRDRTDALEWTLRNLEICLAEVPEFIIRIAGDHFTVNGHPVTERSDRMDILLRQMKVLKTDNMAFKRGITRKGLEDFLEVFTATPEEISLLGGFPKALTICDIPNVTCKTAIFIEVSEEDIIVRKKDLERTREAARRVDEVERDIAEIAAVVAHLKGDPPPEADEQNLADVLRNMASDAQRLAQLIFQAATERQQTKTSADGMTAAMIEAVQRAFTDLKSDPAARTQKGKRELKTKMDNIEKELLALVGNMPDSPSKEPCADAIREAATDTQKAIERDAVAAEYLRRLRALEKAEKRMLRYVADEPDPSTPGPLGGRRLDGGLPHNRGQGALDRNGEGMTGATGTVAGLGANQIAAAVRELGELLQRLNATATALTTTGSPVETMEPQVREVRSLVTRATEDADAKLEALSANLAADAEAVAALEHTASAQGLQMRLSRSQMLEALREITQELCQPMAVMLMILTMISGGTLGAISDAQRSMLNLAEESGQRLARLLDGLQNLVGAPKTLTPDRDLLESTT